MENGNAKKVERRENRKKQGKRAAPKSTLGGGVLHTSPTWAGRGGMKNEGEKKGNKTKIDGGHQVPMAKRRNAKKN